VRRILIGLVEVLAEMNLLEHVCPMFLDGLPTVNRSCVRYNNRVLRVERSDGGGIVVVDCIAMFFNDRDKPLAHFRVVTPNREIAVL
jgi:hypothetical protein